MDYVSIRTNVSNSFYDAYVTVPTTFTVTINVIDINDHAPQFEDDYSRTEILNTDNADQVRIHSYNEIYH